MQCAPTFSNLTTTTDNMVETDITERPYRLFIVGLLTTTSLTLLLYKFIPTYNLLGGQWTIYNPGQTNPELVTNVESYTNIDILLKLGIYNLVYWSIFILIYTALPHLTRIRFQSTYVKFHFATSILAFVFIICLNSKVTFASTYLNSGPSDIYISADLSKYDISQFNREFQFRSSLISTTSLIGIAFLIFGTGLFFANVNKGLRRIEP